jgi:hypothetical protein
VTSRPDAQKKSDAIDRGALLAHQMLNDVAVMTGGAETLVDCGDTLTDEEAVYLVEAIDRHGQLAVEQADGLAEHFDDELRWRMAGLAKGAASLLRAYRRDPSRLNEGFLNAVVADGGVVVEMLRWTLRGVDPSARAFLMLVGEHTA